MLIRQFAENVGLIWHAIIRCTKVHPLNENSQTNRKKLAQFSATLLQQQNVCVFLLYFSAVDSSLFRFIKTKQKTHFNRTRRTCKTCKAATHRKHERGRLDKILSLISCIHDISFSFSFQI